jgi:hypothetical protein
MVMHVVLFRPRADLPASAAATLVTSIETAAREIESVRRFRVGRRLESGPDYPGRGGFEFAYAAFVEFDDRAGLDAYLAHPAHAALGEALNAGLAAAFIVDYAVHDADDGLASFLL